VGAARTTAIATGLRTGRGAERGGEVLLPPAPREVAVTVIARVLDGSAAATAVLLPHGRAAQRRRRLRSLAAGAVLAAGAAFAWLIGAPAWVLGVGAGALASAVPLSSDRYRNLGHALVGGYLVAGSGSLLRRRTVLAADAVIGWNVRSSYFQRRAGLVTLAATTAAGRQSYEVPDVDGQEALAIADEVTPGLLTAFRRGRPPTSG
jgi:putative membrane protein